MHWTSMELLEHMPYEYNALVEFTCIQKGAPAWRTKFCAQTRAPTPIPIMASSPEAVQDLDDLKPIEQSAQSS